MKAGYSLIFASLLGNGLTSFAGDLGNTADIKSGFYTGFGGSFNTIDERFNSTIFTSTFKGAFDDYQVSRNRLSPSLQLGYWRPISSNWLWGISAQWEYLNYKTINVNTTHGQNLPNATFSSINIFGPDIMRDFSAQTKANSVANILFYGGERFLKSYFYVGLGPSLFFTSNNVAVSSVHVGGGDTLVSSLVDAKKTLVGAAAQVGYNYYLNPLYFIGFNYTYSHSQKYQFKNTANAALLNGAINPGPIGVNINRFISISDQHLMVSINRVWG